MAKIAIIGHGNVGHHFANALSFDHHVSIYARNPVPEVNSLSSFKSEGYDFIFFTVPDDAIKKVADSFQTKEAVVVHTSGSRSMQDLQNHERRGVIYPLQTFSKKKQVVFENLQLFLESSAGIENEIQEIARCISTKTKFMDSADRAKIHLAAVFACNFSNHMYHLADSILSDVNLDFKDIKSLVKETLSKALELDPKTAQTGPAVRNDVSTLALHENLIQEEQVKEIYRMITQSIQRTK